MASIVEVDKIIRINFSTKGYMSLYIYKTLSWYMLEGNISRSFKASLDYIYR